jgi:hypothetical protein
MRQIFTFLFLLFAFSVSIAETTSWTGYLADKMCSERLKASPEKAAGHTKECLMEEHCAKSGYGVIVDGKWYKFDKKGNDLTAALLSATQKERGIKVTVTGSMKKGKITVTDLAEVN